MQRTPPKRRKVSPTKSVPVEDAPTPRTPSHIPGPAQDVAKTPERQPSFASPTKASIARHNPQLLNRPSSSGLGAEGKRKNPDDVFAKALGEVRGTVESQPGSIDGETQSNGSTRHGSRVPETQRSTTPRARRPLVGGPLSAKPKRLSRSPVKQPERTLPTDTGFGGLQETANPFQKRGGLRRSPISSSQAEPEPPVEDSLPGVVNPFKKTGLRRSPISSQPARPFEEVVAQPEVSTTPTAPTPVLAAEPQNFDHIQRQEEPTAVEPIPTGEPVIEYEEPVIPDYALEEPVLQAEDFNSLYNALEEPVTEAEEPMIPNDSPEIEEPVVAPKSTPNRRTSHLAELIRNSTASAAAASENPSSTEPQEEAVPTPEQVPEPSVSPANDTPPFDEPGQPEPVSNSPVPQLKEILEEVPRPSKSQRLGPVFDFPISPVKEIVRSVKPQQQAREEPELPPTPTQRGIADPIVTTPPTGIHDTPSKRGRRSKALGERLKSSPLKPRNPPPQEPAKEAEKPQQPKPEVETQISLNIEKKKQNRRKSARFLVPEDPHATKKKARDDLLKELQQLQADVALANQENERLRQHQESGKRRPTVAPNSDELLALLKRSTELPSKPKPKQTSIFKSIGSFLPFSSRRRAQPSSSVPEKPLPSHLPIALDDPLPYLEAFSPLKYTSTIVLLNPDQPSSDSTSGNSFQTTLQEHHIHATHSTGLFAARLTMAVNTSTLAIASLSIPALDSNAEKELGPFIRNRAAGAAKDINVICWAMGRWVEVSIKRAAFFCTVESEFGTIEARAKARSRRKKRKRQAGDEEGDADAEEDELKGRKWTRRQLLPYFGRTSMEVASEEVELRFEWKVGFDWTGEAESAVTVGARVSKSCKLYFYYSLRGMSGLANTKIGQKADDRKILDKVPETFEKLVKERGPLGAVSAVVGLLMDGS